MSIEVLDIDFNQPCIVADYNVQEQVKKIVKVRFNNEDIRSLKPLSTTLANITDSFALCAYSVPTLIHNSFVELLESYGVDYFEILS